MEGNWVDGNGSLCIISYKCMEVYNISIKILIKIVFIEEFHICKNFLSLLLHTHIQKEIWNCIHQMFMLGLFFSPSWCCGFKGFPKTSLYFYVFIGFLNNKQGSLL